MIRTLLVCNQSRNTAVSIVEERKDKSASKLRSCIKGIALGVHIKVWRETFVSKVLVGWGRNCSPPLVYGVGIRGRD